MLARPLSLYFQIKWTGGLSSLPWLNSMILNLFHFYALLERPWSPKATSRQNLNVSFPPLQPYLFFFLFFFLWAKYFSAQCITLPMPSPVPLLFALLFITLLSHWCVFPLPFLTLFTELCPVTISSNNQHLKNVGQKIFDLSLFACTVCFHIIWLIYASLMAQKIQSCVIFYLALIQKD